MPAAARADPTGASMTGGPLKIEPSLEDAPEAGWVVARAKRGDSSPTFRLGQRCWACGGDRRNRLLVSFNRGYRSFQQTYRVCTPAADVAIRRYLDEGAKISREITARFSN